MAISIQKLKENIVSEDQIFSVKNKNVIPLPSNVADGTNCYSLFLRCLCPGIEGEDYIPGFTSNSPYESQADLSEKVCLDLKNLEINYRRLSLFGPKDLEPNEYLGKLFYSLPETSYERGDFHFVIQNQATKIWYHKPGFHNQPLLINIIGCGTSEEPDDLIFTNERTGELSFYYPICYFAVKTN